MLFAVGLAALGSCAALRPSEILPVPANSFGRLYSTIASDRGTKRQAAVAYGPLARHHLDIYHPKAVAEKLPLVIFYYGGGWTEGDRAAYGFVGAALAARGYTTIIPDYRLYPNVMFPDFQEDAALAYAWVARNLGEACGTRRPIILAGHSAGAHMAALLTLDGTYLERFAQEAPAPSGLIGLAGPYAFDPTTWPSTKAMFAPAAANPDAARPVAFARAHAPPALLVHGLDDTTVRLWNTRGLAEALNKQGNVVETVEYPGVGHVGLVMAISKPLRWRAPVLDTMVSFIERRISAEAAPKC